MLLKNYQMFETVLGNMILVWTQEGVTSLHFPEKNDGATLKKMREKNKEALLAKKNPAFIKETIQKIQKHLQGKSQDFCGTPLGFKTTVFTIEVYKKLQQTQAGEILSYGELAKKVKSPKASRAVGSAMARNPCPLIIPCHRVCTSQGKLGNFSAYGGIKIKQKLLEIEGCSKIF